MTQRIHRPQNSGMAYCTLSGPGRFDPTGTQGIALGYDMAPLQGFLGSGIHAGIREGVYETEHLVLWIISTVTYFWRNPLVEKPG